MLDFIDSLSLPVLYRRPIALDSAARIVLVVTNIEALLLFELFWLMQLPLLHFSAMAENLFDVIGQAKVKGHDAGWIDLHIGDIAAASVLPRRLP